MSTIPDQLGVFPLPQTVLFPQGLLPLHVFEPRYRSLLADALDGSNRIVMAVLKPGYEAAPGASPAVYPTACVGRIVEHQKLDDGSSDVILRGEAVVEIGRFVSERPYGTARIRVVPENGSFADLPGAGERCVELHGLLESACPGCIQALREGWSGDFDHDCGVELLHTVAMHLPVSVETKLEWLGRPGSLERWRSMREKLREMGRARSQRTRILNRYGDLIPEDPVAN